MPYRYVTADVFTNEIFGGNPLAVFPDGSGLSTAQMQAVAQEFNLSETVFVFPPESPEHTRKLRIFTPGAEIPFAGHPTVGTAFVLASIGDIEVAENETHIVFEEGVGPIPVTIYAKGDRPLSATLSAAKMPEVGPNPPSRQTLARMISLDVGDIADDPFEPQAVSCGTPFLFVRLAGRDALRRATLDTMTWKEHLAEHWAPNVFVFCDEPEREGSDLRARMFAPGFGIPEDPATGSAATALGGYLAARDATESGTLRWTVEQGFEMGRPSILEIEADKEAGEVVAIRVSGASVLVGRGEMEIPSRA